MRRNYKFETVQIIMCIAIIICSIVVFFKAAELTFLYPVVFGLASLLSVIYALEGILFNRNRVVRKARAIIFFSLAVILAAVTFFAARTVMM